MSDQPKSKGKRPSFTSFWKKGKEKLKGKEIKFVQQGNQQGTPQPPPQQQQVQSSESPESNEQSPDNKDQTTPDKAKLRRAQVRRAQIQHRQRKAEYVKQLELDASHYRDLIAFIESETKALRGQNAAMKLQLQGLGVPLPTTSSQQQPADTNMAIDPVLNTYLTPETQLASLSLTQPQPFGDLSPSTYQPLPNPDSEPSEMFGDINIDDLTVTLKNDELLGTPVIEVSSSSASSSHASPSTTMTDRGLTPEQELTVMNFILALEHVCWNHFFLGDFIGHDHVSDTAMGHSMMASTMCMAGAPDQAFFDRKVSPGGRLCGDMSTPNSTPVNLSWPANGISLDSVYGLATSLNPGDKELTPIQAWFELQSRYPLDLLLDPQIQEALKREFNGVVLCLQFGAVIEREAFESVSSRVLGPWEGSYQ